MILTKQRLLLLSFLIISILSCQKDKESSPNGLATFKLSIQEVNTVNIGRTQSVSTDEFAIAIIDKSNDQEVVSYPRYADMPSSVLLRQGEYKVTASNGTETSADFGNPVYYGESDLSITAGETSNASIECLLSNIKVQITYTEDAKTRFPDVYTEVTTGNGTLEYSQVESRFGFFALNGEPTTLTVNIHYTQDGTARTTTKTYDANANDFFDITINASLDGEGGIDVGVGDENVIEDEIVIGEQPKLSFTDLLTGGSSNTTGKNWVFDKMTLGHMGMGPTDEDSPTWWTAVPEQKVAVGCYDDVLNFNLNGFKYTLTNNGDTHAKDYMAEWFTSRGGTLIQSEDDHTYAIDFADQSDWSWSIIERDGQKYLTFGGDGFPAWNVGGKEYLIQTLNENELYLRTIGSDGNAWYYGFLREGYERPIIPPKPLETKDLFDDFAGNTNTTFTTEGALEFTIGVNNIEYSGNAAELVGKYVRTTAEGDDGWWQLYQTELPYRLDLSERNIFKMKVYVLPSNDFITPSVANETPDWLGEVAMTPTVALRLENSLDGEAWRTRAESLYTIGEDEMGQWVEITFDFTTEMTDANKDWSYSVPATETTIYDKVIIQVGGEGHIRPGTFYISDFRLL